MHEKDLKSASVMPNRPKLFRAHKPQRGPLMRPPFTGTLSTRPRSSHRARALASAIPQPGASRSLIIKAPPTSAGLFALSGTGSLPVGPRISRGDFVTQDNRRVPLQALIETMSALREARDATRQRSKEWEELDKQYKKAFRVRSGASMRVES